MYPHLITMQAMSVINFAASNYNDMQQ